MDFSMFESVLSKLPLHWAIVVAVILLIVMLTVLFVQQHLTANPTYQTPKELRRNARLERLALHLDSVTDPLLRAMLEEERQAVIFSEHTGMHASHQLRTELITLHRQAGGQFSWRGIRRALPHLRRDRQGHLRRGIKWWDTLTFWLFGGMGILLLVGGILWLIFFGSPYFAQYTTFGGFLVAVLPTLGAIAAGLICIEVTAPILWARQLQPYLPALAAPQPAAPHPVPQNSPPPGA